MPKVNKKPDDLIIENEQKTTPGLIAGGNTIQHNELDLVDHLELVKDFDAMIKGCPSISASLKLITYPLESAKRSS